MSPATLQMKRKRRHACQQPLRVAEAIKHWVVAEGMRPGQALRKPNSWRYGHSKGTIRESMRIPRPRVC